MARLICLAEDCTRETIAKSMCLYHYKIQWKHPLYQTWETMKQRCNNPNSHKYYNYGGRGIKICERWLKFANFAADMGEKPTPKHSLDRVDNNGNYEPSNCRWATASQQNFNRRLSRDTNSGVIGVCWDKSKNRWRAHMKINRKSIYLGRYLTKQEAIIARRVAERIYV